MEREYYVKPVQVGFKVYFFIMQKRKFWFDKYIACEETLLEAKEALTDLNELPLINCE